MSKFELKTSIQKLCLPINFFRFYGLQYELVMKNVVLKFQSLIAIQFQHFRHFELPTKLFENLHGFDEFRQHFNFKYLCIYVFNVFNYY